MTGYGRVSNTINNREITIEIKSVNHRYLDLTIKTPRIYNFLDEHIKKNITSEISRGKVDVYVTIDASKTDNMIIEINENLLCKYVDILRKTCKEHEIEDDLKISNIVKLPDILAIKKEETDTESLLSDVLLVLKTAIEQYQSMRECEGLEMKSDILNRKNNILNLVTLIEKRSPQTVLEHREKLFAKLKEILVSNSISEDRILQESAIFADKISVAEETVRLKSHILQLHDMCSVNEPIGRKMDFLIQEFNREANTIGSKSNDAEIAKLVIELKSEIEKIREQIQNVE